MNLITIIPPSGWEGRAMPSHGTKVLLDDGSELQGVTRIELVAEVNDVWRARIDCMARVAVMPGVLAEVTARHELSWWRRALLRMAGVTLDIPACVWRRASARNPDG